MRLGERHPLVAICQSSPCLSQFLRYIPDIIPMDTTMPSLSQHIAQHAAELPEGSLLCPRALLHLGSRAAVDQALSRLARRGQLMRICQGVYVRPIETRFGLRPPAVEKVIEAVAELWGGDHCSLWRCGGELSRPHHSNTSAVGVPDLWPQPSVETRRTDSAFASCPALAVGSTAPASRRRGSRPRLVGRD